MSKVNHSAKKLVSMLNSTSIDSVISASSGTNLTENVIFEAILAGSDKHRCGSREDTFFLNLLSHPNLSRENRLKAMTLSPVARVYSILTNEHEVASANFRFIIDTLASKEAPLWISKNTTLMTKVLEHPLMDTETLATLINTQRATVLSTLAEVAYSEELITSIYHKIMNSKLTKKQMLDSIIYVAKNKNTPIYILKELVELTNRAELIAEYDPKLVMKLLAILIPMEIYPEEAIRSMFEHEQLLREFSFSVGASDFFNAILTNPNLGIEMFSIILHTEYYNPRRRPIFNISFKKSHLYVDIDNALAVIDIAKETNNNPLLISVINNTPHITSRDIYQLALTITNNSCLFSLLKHPNCDEDTVGMLSFEPDPQIQSEVLVHAKTSDELYNNMVKVKTRMRETGNYDPIKESSIFPALNELEFSHHFINANGIDIFLFKGVNSPALVTHMLIGSKHQEEVAFIFGSKQLSSIEALSALQSAYTNTRGKVDRHTYLQTLKHLNNTVMDKSRLLGLAVDGQTLSEAVSFFSLEQISTILENNEPRQAQDIFRMTSTLLSVHHSDVSEKEAIKRKKSVIKRIDTHGLLGHEFHSYLAKKNERDFKVVYGTRPFYQARAALKTDTDYNLPENMTLHIPKDASELRAVGRSQSHCVGSKFYCDRCEDGSSVIFVLSKGSRANTFTFQYDREQGVLVQAEGLFRTQVPKEYIDVSQRVFSKIMSVI